VRFLFVPEARKNKIAGRDFFYRLPSSLLTAFRKVAERRPSFSPFFLGAQQEKGKGTGDVKDGEIQKKVVRGKGDC